MSQTAAVEDEDTVISNTDLGSSVVAVMQSAQTRRRDYSCLRGRLLFGRSAIGRVFAQAIVNSIFVVIVHVITHEAE